MLIRPGRRRRDRGGHHSAPATRGRTGASWRRLPAPAVSAPWFVRVMIGRLGVCAHLWSSERGTGRPGAHRPPGTRAS